VLYFNSCAKLSTRALRNSKLQEHGQDDTGLPTSMKIIIEIMRAEAKLLFAGKPCRHQTNRSALMC
jgi:hypothetical protein